MMNNSNNIILKIAFLLGPDLMKKDIYTILGYLHNVNNESWLFQLTQKKSTLSSKIQRIVLFCRIYLEKRGIKYNTITFHGQQV